MAYEELAALIEQHRAELSRRAAQAALEKGLRVYAGQSLPEIEKGIDRSLNQIIQYVREGETEQWRNYILTVSETLLGVGHTVEEVNAGGENIVAVVAEMVDRKVYDVNAKARYLRRLEGLKTLAKVSAVSAHFKTRAAQRTAKSDISKQE